MKAAQPSFLTLAQDPHIDEETAYTICRMIDRVGWQLKEPWDWNWLEKKRDSYRSLIDKSLLNPAWKLLSQEFFLSLQTINDDTKRISTMAPLEGLTNLRILVLQNNHISDLQPLSKMVNLISLHAYGNEISDLAPLNNLPFLEELQIGNNPLASLAVLEQLVNLRKLAISTNHVTRLVECKSLASLRVLEIRGDDAVENLAKFPEMPSLKVLTISSLKDTAGVERFTSLETLRLSQCQFLHLDGVESLNSLTHLDVWTSHPISLLPVKGLYALRCLTVNAPQVQNLSALSRLPVLHEIRMRDQTKSDSIEFEALTKSLTTWAEEFKAPAKRAIPSLNVEIVSQEVFDLYDGKKPYGIEQGECEDGMFSSERKWLVGELRAALEALFTEEADFVLPIMNGLHRSERLSLYTLRAYESFREIAAAVQAILCETRNDWIIYFQSLLEEGPDCEELPEDATDFIVWIYPDKIVATEEHAVTVATLIDWT